MALNALPRRAKMRVLLGELHTMVDDAQLPPPASGQTTLRRGAQGSAVLRLQQRLQAIGIDPGPLDGTFGPQTEAAVREFQQAEAIQSDGVAGPETLGLLEHAQLGQFRTPPGAPAFPLVPSAPDAPSGSVSRGQAAVRIAEKYLGVRYVWGGASPRGFDCSGLMQYAYRQLGISLPRVARQQAHAGKPVSKADLRPGDLVYFTNTDGPGITHIGMYIGAGKFIQAPHTGDVVKISSLSEPYYTLHYGGATRVV